MCCLTIIDILHIHKTCICKICIFMIDQNLPLSFLYNKKLSAVCKKTSDQRFIFPRYIATIFLCNKPYCSDDASQKCFYSLSLHMFLHFQEIRNRHWLQVMSVTGSSFQLEAGVFKLCHLLDIGLIKSVMWLSWLICQVLLF